MFLSQSESLLPPMVVCLRFEDFTGVEHSLQCGRAVSHSVPGH